MESNTIIGISASIAIIAVGAAMSFALVTTADTAAIESSQDCTTYVIDAQDERINRLIERVNRLEEFHFKHRGGIPGPAPSPAKFQQDIERIRSNLFSHPMSWIQRLYPDRTIVYRDVLPCYPELCGMTGRCPFLGTTG